MWLKATEWRSALLIAPRGLVKTLHYKYCAVAGMYSVVVGYALPRPTLPYQHPDLPTALVVATRAAITSGVWEWAWNWPDWQRIYTTLEPSMELCSKGSTGKHSSSLCICPSMSTYISSVTVDSFPCSRLVRPCCSLYYSCLLLSKQNVVCSRRREFIYCLSLF